MNITNHHKGNYTFVSHGDRSVMYGTIEMTRQEFDEAVRFLKRSYAIAKRYNHTYIRDSLAHAFSWTLKHYPKDNRVCLGVTATELLSKRYSLPRYKKQNYLVQII